MKKDLYYAIVLDKDDTRTSEPTKDELSDRIKNKCYGDHIPIENGFDIINTNYFGGSILIKIH